MDRETTASVVIGAQFGDEGKGQVVAGEAAATGDAGIVVRYNGGAQAGHTVIAPDGRRHVFSHVGSGAFSGAATFLSRWFVSHPILFLKEQAALAALRVKPVVWVDPASPVTTPYDMLINQIVERARGDGRHGSCGVGFGETIERNLSPRHALTVRDLTDPALADRLDAIRRDYTPTRLARLGYGAAYLENADLFQSEAVLAHFVEDAGRFLEAVTVSEARTATRGQVLWFEGAQGLRLDQDRGCFPYVTRSNTGLRNVLELAEELGLERLEVSYVTRAYLTRHGAGPLPHELPEPPYPGIEDATNRPNPYQGTLRFGWLDLDGLGQALAADLADARRFPALAVNARLQVSCLDQLGDEPVIYYRQGNRRQGGPEQFLATATKITGLPCNYSRLFSAAANSRAVTSTTGMTRS
jgi:adenylosuccinate synthase